MTAEPVTAALHRLTADEYHRMIESGGFDEDARIELIDGLLLDMSPKTPRHENAIAWLTERLVLAVDRERFQVRACLGLSLGDSEPEPDLAVIEHAAPRPYHPATAALVVEVSVSSLARDLRTKPAIYARAGVTEYWVVDLDGRRVVTHRAPGSTGYADVDELGPDASLEAAHVGLGPIPVAELLAAAG